MNGWKTLWIDPRRISQCLVGASLVVGLLAFVIVSVAVAQSLPEKQGDAVKVTDIVRVQWWAITGLMSLVGILISFFIIRELNSNKSNIRLLWEKKLGKEEHSEIDHSQFCALCRNGKAH